ncbi:PspC domain-containing protein [Pseudonocardia sp.]|jgi:phage shock protein PspC (stress-responsive transcriptional regulator)|uniref:PspC domain-containing protein n=1 Tax=Pseudonocardia sp. TaxID=60912 RepID=UPI003D122199
MDTDTTSTGTSIPTTDIPGDVPADPTADVQGAPKKPFRLVRSRSDRMLGGVCGGLAAQLDIDVSLLRLGLVALTILGAGAGAVLYVAAWVLAPEVD